MLVDLVRATTPDGLKLDGAVAAPAAGVTPHPHFDLAIALHGVGSNFYSAGLWEGLVAPLADAGLTLLRVNTRGHDALATASGSRKLQGAACESVDECRLDVRGWLRWAEEAGYRRVLLMGHSLGGIKVVYAAAHESLAAVKAVVALSPPRLSSAAFRQSSESGRYLDSLATAEQMILEGRGEQLFLARFPFPLYITAAGYVDKYGPAERYNLLRYVARVPQPMLLTYGSLELGAASFAGVPEAVSAALASRPECQVTILPDADHNYTGQGRALAATLLSWLAGWHAAGRS